MNPTPPINLRDLTSVAVEAGEIMRVHFRPFGMKREVKSDITPMTKADTEINDLVINHFRRFSGEIDIVSEEGSSRTNSPWRINCDPVDGTFPYTWGIPVSTFMISLSYEHEPVMGVIYDPFTHRMYQAEKGLGALLNSGSPLRVSKASTLEKRQVIGYTSWPGCPYNILKVCHLLEKRGATLVNLQSIGYIDVAVATGEFVGTIFPGPSHHDTAPGHVIVTEAGGMVTDIFGEPLDYSKDTLQGHIMSNGKIHHILVEAVKECN